MNEDWVLTKDKKFKRKGAMLSCVVCKRFFSLATAVNHKKSYNKIHAKKTKNDSWFFDLLNSTIIDPILSLEDLN